MEEGSLAVSPRKGRAAPTCCQLLCGCLNRPPRLVELRRNRRVLRLPNGSNRDHWHECGFQYRDQENSTEVGIKGQRRVGRNAAATEDRIIRQARSMSPEPVSPVNGFRFGITLAIAGRWGENP